MQNDERNKYPENLTNPQSKREIDNQRNEQLKFLSARVVKLKNSSDDAMKIFEVYNNTTAGYGTPAEPTIDVTDSTNWRVYRIHIDHEQEYLYTLTKKFGYPSSFTMWQKDDDNTFFRIQLEKNASAINYQHWQNYPISLHFQKIIVDYKFNNDEFMVKIVSRWDEGQWVTSPKKKCRQIFLVCSSR